MSDTKHFVRHEDAKPEIMNNGITKRILTYDEDLMVEDHMEWEDLVEDHKEWDIMEDMNIQEVMVVALMDNMDIDNLQNHVIIMMTVV